MVEILSRFICVACLCLATGTILGCKGDQDSGLISVTGTVLLDGKPLPMGTVVTTVEKGRGARADIGSNGEFTLQTSKLGVGAEPGVHYVTVTAYQSTDPGNPEAPSKSLVPARYASAFNSGLMFEVKPGAENHFKLELSSK